MPYEMQAILAKCDAEDLKVLLRQIDSHVNLSSDTELKANLGAFDRARSAEAHAFLLRTIEREIRYLGSSELAYAKRKLIGIEDPPGVGIFEVIEDVSARLKVKQKYFGTVEARLERLVRATAERTFFKLTPEQQRELFEKAGIGKKQTKEFFEKLKSNKAHFVPLLLSVLGPVVTKQLVQGLAISVVAGYMGKEAAKAFIANLALRFPLWAEWLGPIVWGISLGWLAIDLQAAAYRKTIPILLYLGIVGLRDGPEEGEAFWDTPSNEG
jgi:uncharacterized protein YaaW (UPF0174 family)